MLKISDLRKTSELFGIIEIHVALSPCNGIVNNWRLEIDGILPGTETDGIEFISSSFRHHEECSASACLPPKCPLPLSICTAVFTWDTRFYSNGIRTITAYAGTEQSETLNILVDNVQKSYRILNKKLANGDIIRLSPPDIEIQLTKEIADFIESLPGKTGLIDQEIFANERFTMPYNGSSVIIGDTPVQRILDLHEYEMNTFGDTVQINVSETAAKYLIEEFASGEIEIGLLNSTDKLRHIIKIINPDEFPAINAIVAEGE